MAGDAPKVPGSWSMIAGAVSVLVLMFAIDTGVIAVILLGLTLVLGLLGFHVSITGPR